MRIRHKIARATLLTATALGCVVAACIGAPQARAQFVCIGTFNGGLALGAGAVATGDGSSACGTFANATGVFATATGTFATANGFAASAAGGDSLAQGTFATATGAGSFANGQNATAIGGFSTANGINATALGQSSLALGNASTAIGQGSVAFTGATAIGQGAAASFANSTAIGAGAVTTAPNQMAFGTPSSTYVAPGITSAASKAAQSGPLQIVTSDTGGNLATNTAAGLGLASLTDINAINSQLGGMNTRINDLDGRTTKALNGVSMAFAMGGTPWLLPTERFAVSMDWGAFQGTNAVALTAAYRLGTNVQANGGLAYGANGGGVGGRAGVRVGW
jgi:trimeric autotransporter adhesin